MHLKKYLFLFILTVSCKFLFQQNNALINADKMFIEGNFQKAVSGYEAYLKKQPKDYYASRQAAICYTKLSIEAKAIDFWPAVVDNAKVTDKDKLDYVRCLLANYRKEDAVKELLYNENSKTIELKAWAQAYKNNALFFEDSALVKVVLANGINTPMPEVSPVMYKTNLIFSNSNKKNIKDKGSFTRFQISTRTDSVTFQKPSLFSPQIQGKKINNSLCFSSDDSTVYFTRTASNKDLKTQKIKLPVQYLYYSRMNSFGDAHPEIESFIYNSPNYNIKNPSVSTNKQRIYFSSDMPGGFGNFDIWYCDWDKGAWGKPINCGSTINTIGNEEYPCISNEGILYFVSDTKPGIGGYDIFYAETNSKNQFDEAQNIGAPINSQWNDFGIYLNKNGRTGYFSSNRKNADQDYNIYFFANNKPRPFNTKIKFVDSLNNTALSASYKILQPKPLLSGKIDSGAYLKLRVKAGKTLQIESWSDHHKLKQYTQAITPSDTIITVSLKSKSEKSISGNVYDVEINRPIAGVKVLIYDENGNNFYNATTDSSGYYKAINLPEGQKLFIGASKHPDYFSNTSAFTLKRDSDIIYNISTQKITIGKAIKIENIYFDEGKYNVRADAAKELDKLVKLMKDNTDIKIELSSHTDCKGNASANLLLSDKRAKSSASYIISKGVDKNRIIGKGYGESKLVNNCACEGKTESHCSEAELALNRRTEFKVIGFIQDAKKKAESKSLKKAK
ncbi:MAG: OmpA family protein [Bacteroidetes bacterium]|nr:OmpA family protein [Bacteroidota bacterium]